MRHRPLSERLRAMRHRPLSEQLRPPKQEPASPIITVMWVLGTTMGVAFWTVVIWRIIQLVSQ